MNTWFSSNLGDAMLAGRSIEQIKAMFQVAHENSGYLDGMAVFMRHESDGRLHCEVKVYFTPETAVVAKKVGALPCSKPSPNGLGLLVGPENSRSLFFPRKEVED